MLQVKEKIGKSACSHLFVFIRGSKLISLIFTPHPDVMFTHDWPQDLPGAKEFLLRKRPNLKESIDKDQLASPMHNLLLKKLKPKHWFSGYLHIRFQTDCVHSNEPGEPVEKTRFLALNKVKTGRRYLQMVEVPSDDFNIDGLEYDLEWLAILRLTNQWISTQQVPLVRPPQPWTKIDFDFKEEKTKIEASFKNEFKISEKFVADLPFRLTDSKPIVLEDIDPQRKINCVNEQTKEFCHKLGIKDPMQSIIDTIEFKVVNPDEIEISDSDSVVDWGETLIIDPPTSNQFKDSLVRQNGSSSNQQNCLGDILAFPELPSGFNSILNQRNQAEVIANDYCRLTPDSQADDADDETDDCEAIESASTSRSTNAHKSPRTSGSANQ